MKQNLRLMRVTCLAYCVGKEPWKAIDYLKEVVRVLKEQQEMVILVTSLGTGSRPAGGRPPMEVLRRLEAAPR